ncbi:hypothetical protein A8L34_27820 [Bacillus sp. FJAT-27264]|uniref:hypothetical protein n=1 Tax=Paenibacillus sp. (strain DSM 101736 / FJAT-27264) TaxID=1850362 RepID=UPI000807A2C7|nr:hypothetical protein [Bacillus sp. FJAT-27264]OBZ15857.1 hypothetical protein A8L34_27820 [Bacillus sp. FJAT-27264]
MLQLSKSYLHPIHSYAYNPTKGVPAITGLVYVIPEPTLPSRLCYEVTYSDGEVDYVAVSDVEQGSYKISASNAL